MHYLFTIISYFFDIITIDGVDYMKKEEINNMLKSGIIIMIYGLMMFTNIQTLPFRLFHIEIASVPLWIRMLYSLGTEVILLCLIIYFFKDQLKRDLEDLKINHKTYFQKYFKYWFVLLAVMMTSNLLIQAFTNSNQAANEEAIRELMKTAPIYTFISAVLVAPFLEEFIFRLSFRHLIKNKYLFILISGLTFGSLHVITSVNVITDYLYIIPYSVPGLIFAYLYVKSENIFTSTAIHFVHNGILLSLQILLYFFL